MTPEQPNLMTEEQMNPVKAEQDLLSSVGSKPHLSACHAAAVALHRETRMRGSTEAWEDLSEPARAVFRREALTVIDAYRRHVFLIRK